MTKPPAAPQHTPSVGTPALRWSVPAERVWDALSDGPVIRALRHGVMLLMPLLLAAALAVLFNNFPVQAYQDALMQPSFAF